MMYIHSNNEIDKRINVFKIAILYVFMYHIICTVLPSCHPGVIFQGEGQVSGGGKCSAFTASGRVAGLSSIRVDDIAPPAAIRRRRRR